MANDRELTFLDVNMGWPFQWEYVDAIARNYQEAIFLPIILERIRRRHAARPEYYEPPELFVTDQKILATWDFLEGLDRPDVHIIDASQGEDSAYEDVKQYLAARTPQGVEAS